MIRTDGSVPKSAVRNAADVYRVHDTELIELPPPVVAARETFNALDVALDAMPALPDPGQRVGLGAGAAARQRHPGRGGRRRPRARRRARHRRPRAAGPRAHRGARHRGAAGADLIRDHAEDIRPAIAAAGEA